MMRRRLDELSRGYKQRVGLAEVLLHSPDVLVLDEPTIGLDPAQIRSMRDLIKQLAEEHTVIDTFKKQEPGDCTCDKEEHAEHTAGPRAQPMEEYPVRQAAPEEIKQVHIPNLTSTVLHTCGGF